MQPIVVSLSKAVYDRGVIADMASDLYSESIEINIVEESTSVITIALTSISGYDKWSDAIPKLLNRVLENSIELKLGYERQD